MRSAYCVCAPFTLAAGSLHLSATYLLDDASLDKMHPLQMDSYISQIRLSCSMCALILAAVYYKYLNMKSTYRGYTWRDLRNCLINIYSVRESTALHAWRKCVAVK